jgi:hypothetical protein
MSYLGALTLAVTSLIEIKIATAYTTQEVLIHGKAEHFLNRKNFMHT